LGIDGLIGLRFLRQFNYEVRSLEAGSSSTEQVAESRQLDLQRAEHLSPIQTLAYLCGVLGRPGSAGAG